MRELRRFLPYFAPHRKSAVLLMAILVVSSGLSVVTPFFYQLLIDRGIGGGQLSVVAGMVALIAVSMLAMEGLFLAQTRLTLKMRESVFLSVKRQVYAHLMDMPPGYYADRHKGRLLSRLLSDVQALQNLFLDRVVFFARDLLVGLLILSIMLAIEWRMVLAASFFLPLFYVIYRLFRRRITALGQSVQEKKERLTGRWQEDLAAVRELQSYSVTAERVRETDVYIRESEAARRRLDMAYSVASSSTIAIRIAGLLVIWGMGAREVLEGRMTIGVLVSVSFFLTHIINLFYSAYYILMDYRSAVPSARRVLELLDEQPSFTERDGALERDVRGAVVRFEGVAFRYRPDSPLLEEVHLEFRPGDVAAVIGASGQGKTTLVHLLQRFMDPQAGRITLDGTDLRDMRLSALRRAVAVVSQDNVLLDDTLRNNIVFHREGISEERFAAACREAKVDLFAEKLENGYDTVIGERGAKLSEGQKKRVAIARALLEDPYVLVLDEATAMLDEETEADILETVTARGNHRIVLLVTHKTANLRYANRVVRIRDGRAEEVNRTAEGQV